MVRLKILYIILSLFICSCSRSAEDKNIDRAVVENTINASIGWAKNKDFKLLYSIISNDSNYIEVDPTPGVILGFDEFKKNEPFWNSPNFKAIKYDIRDLKINLSERGDVAWFYCILDDVNEWKGEPANWLNTRWTGVLEKRNGYWIMVQMHFSFAKS
ncbi:MAG: nuclear transport factor 2 family protein [Ignavibacteriales bacterium]|nr:nuclear transport factor 2 family protein [Ignavibacteriales bacterium]